MAGQEPQNFTEEDDAELRHFARSLSQIVRVFREKADDPTPPEHNLALPLCDDLEALFEEARTQGLWIMQQEGTLGPIFALIGRAGVIVGLKLADGMPDPDMARVAIAAGVAATMAKAQVDAYVFQMEAWMAGGMRRDLLPPVMPADNDLRLREHPDRIEVVYIRASTRSASALRVFSIERDAAGYPVALVEFDSMARFGVAREVFLATVELDPNPLVGNLFDFPLPDLSEGVLVH